MPETYKEKIRKRNKELEAQITRLYQDEEKIIKNPISNGCQKRNINKKDCLYLCENRGKCEINKKILAIEKEIEEIQKTIDSSEMLVNDLMWD